jgi:UDP-N-acetylglucosamine diphosphorylase/glucosamine-1-phosphate N-acetyltransferase
MRVCLFEDHRVPDLEPLTLTRPVFDLLCGLTSLAAKQYRCFAAHGHGALVRPHLAEVCRLGPSPGAINDLAWLRAGPTALVNGRWLPPAAGLRQTDAADGYWVGLVDDEVACAVVGPEHLAACSVNTIDDCLAAWKATLPCRPAGGRLFRYLWEIVACNGEQVIRDWESRQMGNGEWGMGNERPDPPFPIPHSPFPIAVVGPRTRLAIDPEARLEPMVVADTTGGPVVVERGAVVTAFTRLEGPCCVGAGTQVLGAKVRAGTTLGPECRIGGEVEASIVQGHSNKYHDGFLGHAYVGEWVNLGAGTQNSDLRNDYGEVNVAVNGRLVRTGQTKVGCFLGDHTKTALGTLLNTGTNVGAFCNLLPPGLLPRYIPSFSRWWNGVLTENGEIEPLLQTAAEVMRRRGHTLTAAHAALYRTLFEQTAAQRQQALRDTEQRRLRRSA